METKIHGDAPPSMAVSRKFDKTMRAAFAYLPGEVAAGRSKIFLFEIHAPLARDIVERLALAAAHREYGAQIAALATEVTLSDLLESVIANYAANGFGANDALVNETAVVIDVSFRHRLREIVSCSFDGGRA